MYYIILILGTVLALPAALANETYDRFKVNSITYPDGVFLENSWVDMGMRVTIAGPGNFRFTQKYSAFEPAFIDINNTDERILTDGLYRYEVRPVARVLHGQNLSREDYGHDNKMQRSSPRFSPVNGSFRIIDGSVVDSGLPEYETAIEQGTEE